ncbi:MAG: diguanylate cyclase [Candidatus Rokubacteria bacterium]|nr:diguanylate cyclase [Candidatus Rokubacteria bacterium]
MAHEDLASLLQQIGKDPSRLIFEDELTGLYNRRFLHNYFEYKVPWDALEDYPLSLIMLDVDHFKQVNDRYGHQTGDQALVKVAGLLKEVAGETGLAIRYAGDEFILLFPRAAKPAALEAGERLLRRVREETLRVEGDQTLHLTLSMGVATAPDDAQDGTELVQQADTALYHTKKSGRNGLTNVAEVDRETVSPKAALHQLDGASIPGREVQLIQVAQAFKKFGQGQNQFLIVQGAPGMGKSTFLEAIRRNLTAGELAVVRVNGVAQETFQPYSLTVSILIALLSQRPDGGAEVFAGLTREESDQLAKILPHLGDADEDRAREADASAEGLLPVIVRLVPKILDGKPLVLFIDDLEFADEATLLVLRQLMLGETPLFVCGTSQDLGQLGAEAEEIPLVRFLSAQREGLGIATLALPPLTAQEIEAHLRGIFPQLSMPERFPAELAEITRGNTLFLTEILRKLVFDQKITLVGQQWVIQPLPEGYLPRSLEEIVSEKIAALDEEDRQLLDQVSAFGEAVPLSMLTGSSERKEARVLEFVDTAVTQGLLRSDFQFNDETLRFAGKQIQEIAYDDIPPERRQELHGLIARYQETLYHRRLLPSAAPLGYHFQRSTDEEKGRRYAELAAVHAQRAFTAREATRYGRERLGEAAEAPLDPASLAQVPSVIRLLLTAVRSITLYPAESKALLSVIQQLQDAVNQLLARDERVALAQLQGTVLANGQPLDPAKFRSVAETFVETLGRLDLEGIVFQRGLTADELKIVLEALGRTSRKVMDQRFWQRFAAERGLQHVRLKQVRYIERLDPMGFSALLRAGEQKLDREDLPGIQEIIRSLLSAARNIKLYPVQTKAVSRPIEQLGEAVQRTLSRRPVLTLARVGSSLVVNGETVDTTDFKAVASSFLEFLESIGLSSLTFVERAAPHELQAFIGALGQAPATGWDSEAWKRFARERGLSSILFDQRRYEVRAAPTAKDGGGGPAVEEGQEESDGVAGVAVAEPAAEGVEPGVAGPGAPAPAGALPEGIPERVGDLLLHGKTHQIRAILAQLFEGFRGRDREARARIIKICRGAIERLPVASQPRFAELATDLLLSALAQETEPATFEEIATLLHRMAANLILFAEYPLASRILLPLHAQHRRLRETGDARADLLARTLEERVEPETLRLLGEDLKSGDPTRQRRAAQLLGSLGRATTPLLVDMIKEVDELRVRQLAASLLAELGPEAAATLKRELVQEVGARGRARTLEVIDLVTRDVKAEFPFAVGDLSSTVRQAAFRLAERLNDPELAGLILEYARSPELDVATAAIRFLARHRPAGAAEALVAVLNSATETERAIACCRALGQIADPVATEPLARVLAPRGLFARKRWGPSVRAAAAAALGQIPDPRAAEALAPLVDDPDPRVREIARARLEPPHP